MKTQPILRQRGFTLLETVIAIGVLAVLLTGFMVVFAPAAEGIRKSINVQQADRMASALEQELVQLRNGEQSTIIATGFDKAYTMIEGSMKTTPEVIFLYEYRGDIKSKARDDGTYAPFKDSTKGKVGEDYVVVPMARRRIGLNGGTDSYFEKDLEALEGRVYAVKVKQLVFSGGQLTESKKEVIEDPTPGEPLPTGTTASGKYPEAVIAFSAGFYMLPSTSFNYLKAGGGFNPTKLKNPVFTRNLAVRR
jgi:prepilin-type N-terminal cleavage/methylation domain-containing protein